MKCFNCSEEFDRDTMVALGSNLACPDCSKEIEEKDRRYLIVVISQLYNIPKPTGMMFAQMKRYREKDGWHYRNMRLALEYAVYVQGWKLDPKFGLKVIEYNYDDAIAYYKQQFLKSKSSEHVTYETVKIVTNKPKLVNKDYAKKRMVDMEGKYGQK